MQFADYTQYSSYTNNFNLLWHLYHQYMYKYAYTVPNRSIVYTNCTIVHKLILLGLYNTYTCILYQEPMKKTTVGV